MATSRPRDQFGHHHIVVDGTTAFSTANMSNLGGISEATSAWMSAPTPSDQFRQ